MPDPFFPGLFDIEITYPYVGAQIVYDSRKDALLGSKGLFASLDLSGTGGFLGSDFRYTRAFGQVNLYVPIFEKSRFPLLWAQSARAGLARSPAGESLLPDARFFAGGEYSVRGYERDTLGPTEELGDLTSYVGGRNLLVLNEELRFPLFWRLTGVAFFDAASVFDSSKDFSTYLSKSLGLGLRAITPVGVFRLDAARPLDRRESEKAYRLYFGFGNTF
ncbi:MAG: BamA/TamA family outer membrane protein [Acidobacteria bacterium]|nr:BamA/TamA family outer membrane protein [Acidobacteriota bacterium]